MSRRIKWTGHVARIRRAGMYIGYRFENKKKRDHQKDQDAGECTILKLIFRTWYGLDLSGSEQGPVEGSCEHGNEPLGSTKCREILE
jgi:hypothetical protein